MNLSDYDYNLPEEKIARHPAAKRDQSKMLVVNRESGDLQDKIFSDISSLIEYIRNYTA